MNKFWELVPITEKPEKDGWYNAANPGQEFFPIMYYFGNGEWISHNSVNLSFYLRPVSSPCESDAVEFLEAIRDYERESGNKICYDERSSQELYDFFKANTQKK